MKRGCALALGLLVLGILGFLGHLTNAIFPGMSDSYSNSSREPQVFRLTEYADDRVVRVRIAPDYITSLSDGPHWGYAFLYFRAYLPDMTAEPEYMAAHRSAFTVDGDVTGRALMEKLDVGISNFGEPPKPGDPSYDPNKQKNEDVRSKKPMRKNPYSGFDAYIWRSDGGDEIVDKTESTTYVPKNSASYYIECFEEGSPDAVCDILFEYKQLLQVDVAMDPKNIPNSAFIFEKVTLFLDNITTLK